MRNMTDYEDFPPLTNFKRVLSGCPQSALLYCHLWKIKPKNNNLKIVKDEIKKAFLISPTLFRNNILAIGRLDLIAFEETSDDFYIRFL